MTVHSRDPHADADEGLDRKVLAQVRKRFVQVNRDKLERLRRAAREREADLIDLLPLLWHVNHPSLPGWVDYDTPCSLSDYTPTQATLLAGKKIAKAFEYERRAALRRDLYALFLMGSTGSLGHSGESDLDVWLIYRPDLSHEALHSLQEKAQRISKYAEQQGVALHVYLMTEEQVRSGAFGPMSSEHSGSTQHMLLLDEFYRSAILLAGRSPLWWLVPPEQHLNYAAYTERLLTQRFVKAGEYIDFGNVVDIPAGEFFSGTLWQLNKSLDAPYKSVLKLALMEVYAQLPPPPPLSLIYKSRIYHNQTTLNDLDPYLLIYHAVERHLIEQGQLARLDLIRRALYLKTGIKLSQSPRVSDWQRDLLQKLVKQWGWPRSTLQMLDQRRYWKIEAVISERQQLSEVLNQSARTLQQFARQHSDLAEQNQQELTILSRKLFATLEKRPGKIERHNLHIAPDLSESALTIVERSNEGCEILRGLLDKQQLGKERPLKRSNDLIELLAWTHANELLSRRTRLALISDNPAASLAEAATLARDLFDFFPQPLPLASNDALDAPAQVQKLALFINVGVDPMAELSRQGLQLVSSQTDALAYGASHELLVQKIDLVWLTSWGELHTSQFHGDDAVPEFLGKLHALLDGQKAKPQVQAFCASPIRARSIANRMQLVVEELLHEVFPLAKHAPVRYLLRLGKGFVELRWEEQQLSLRRCADISELMSWLAEPITPACELIFEQQTARALDFDLIYRQRRQGSLQLFYRRVLERIDIFVLDEADALVLCQYPNTELKPLLQAWQQFLIHVSDRQRRLSGLPPLPTPDCFELCSSNGEQRTQLRRLELTLVTPESWALSASLQAGKPLRQSLQLQVQQQEFSLLENGDAFLSQAVQQVLRLRQQPERYPVYLSDLIITDVPFDVSTAYFVRQKKQIEELLNSTLN